MAKNQLTGTKRTRIVGAVVAATLLVLLYVFFIYLPNTPQNVWRRGMASIGVGLERLIEEDAYVAANATKTEGSLTITEPIQFSAELTGSADINGFAEMTLNAQYEEYNPQFDLYYDIASSSYPQIYFMFEGLEQIIDTESGAGTFADATNGQKLEGVWWLLDYEELVEQELITQADLDEALGTGEDRWLFTPDDQRELMRAFVASMNEYVFTSEADDMIFDVIEDLGVEEFEGMDSRKYLVDIDKNRLEDLLLSMRDNLSATAAWSKLDQEGLITDISNSDIKRTVSELDSSGARIEAWVGLDNKVLRNLRFSPAEEDAGNEYVEFSLLINDTELTEIPMRMKAVFDTFDTGEITIDYVVNTDNFASRFNFDIDMTLVGGDSVVGSLQLNSTPLAEAPVFTPPVQSESIFDLWIFNELQ